MKQVLLTILLSSFITAVSYARTKEDPKKPARIDREAIRAAIRDNTKSFQKCYNEALQRNKETHGKIVIQWYITDGGKAKDALVKSNSTGDEAFGLCLANAVVALTYPVPPSDQLAEVTYPFVFTAD